MSCDLTVLMAVRNGGPFLRTAIDSILAQTYREFHFLVVDDESTDDSREIVRAYTDGRIELLCLDRNGGQSAALNIGLRRASTPWVARMDADDYSAPTRFEEQMGALKEDPSLSCIGTWAWTFRDDPHVCDGTITPRLNHAEIKRELLRTTPIIHGSIVVNKDAILDVGGYNDRYRYTADIEMYDRFLAKYRAANIPRELLGVRRHAGQGSRSKIAVDESIEILTRRLSSHNYPPKDAATVRSTLARSFLYRACHSARERKWTDLWKDLWCGLRTSPGSFGFFAFRGLVIFPFPFYWRARLKRSITRIGRGPAR